MDKTILTAQHGLELLNAMRCFLTDYSSDPEVLENTPERYVKALREMLSGAPAGGLYMTIFHSKSDELVVVRDIEFQSICQHHLMPFFGVATVGYLPDGSVAGLSKIPRLVGMHSRKLQLQENLTVEIADDMMGYLHPRGVGVVLEAIHTCLSCRGARQPSAKFVTSCLRGCFKEGDLRSEFLSLVSRR